MFVSLHCQKGERDPQVINLKKLKKMINVLIISNVILVLSVIALIVIAAKFTYKSTKFELQCEVLTDMLKANGINIGDGKKETTEEKEVVAHKKIGFVF